MDGASTLGEHHGKIPSRHYESSRRVRTKPSERGQSICTPNLYQPWPIFLAVGTVLPVQATESLGGKEAIDGATKAP